MMCGKGKTTRAVLIVLRLMVLALMGSLVWLVGCTGRGPVTVTGVAVTIELATVFPGSATSLGPGTSANIQATVIDPDNHGVTWTFSPAAFGALSNSTSTSVTYTAPTTLTTPTSVTVTATSITNPNVAASVQIPTSPVTVLLATPFAGINTAIVPLPDQTVNQGGTLPIQAEVANAPNSGNPLLTWTLSPANGAGSLTSIGGGSLVNTTSANVTYTAPTSVSSPVTATVTVTHVDSNAAASVRITVFPAGGGPNVAVLTVNGGPVPGQIYHNGAVINGVTICNPGQLTCQTIDGILVDTGSYGLRILQSEMPSLNLPTSVNAQGNILENCYAFPNGSYVWGPVATADIYIAGAFASSYAFTAGSSLPIQVINSGVNAGAGVPNGCSNGGADLNTPQLLGVNGILGIGPEPNDCTLAGVNYCDGSKQPVPPNVYYACPATGCQAGDTPVLVPAQQQLTNPELKLFGAGGNGVAITLPPVSGAESSVSGTLTLGLILPQGVTTYTLDSHDHFTTVYNGQSFVDSFVDSGSRAIFFPGSLPTCSVKTQFFCPPALMSLSATNQGATEGKGVVDFAVDNADNLFSTQPNDAAFDTLAGPNQASNCSGGAGACGFDWGLPFFYGRTVYVKIDICGPASCPALSGGWWAY